jgi:hypothetical protein
MLPQGTTSPFASCTTSFVARDILSNNERNYKRLGSIVNDARLAGMIDWNAIEDRTREIVMNSHWDSPAQILDTCARQYAIDKWQNQKHYVEVWVEKEALMGVVEKVSKELDLTCFSCRGYSSQSAMWRAGMRMILQTTALAHHHRRATGSPSTDTVHFDRFTRPPVFSW